MAEKILKTPDNKRVVVNRKSDTILYDSPNNPPNTGTKYTQGTDLCAHKARSGTVYFYLYHWSMWQGSEDSYGLIEPEQAKEFLLEKAGLTGWASIDDCGDRGTIEEYFPGIFEEDA